MGNRKESRNRISSSPNIDLSTEKRGKQAYEYNLALSEWKKSFDSLCQTLGIDIEYAKAKNLRYGFEAWVDQDSPQQEIFLPESIDKLIHGIFGLNSFVSHALIGKKGGGFAIDVNKEKQHRIKGLVSRKAKTEIALQDERKVAIEPRISFYINEGKYLLQSKNSDDERGDIEFDLPIPVLQQFTTFLEDLAFNFRNTMRLRVSKTNENPSSLSQSEKAKPPRSRGTKR